MFRFENPAALQFFWFLPIVLFLTAWALKQNKKILEKSLGARLAPFLSASVSPQKRRVKVILEVLSLTCFILALARPQQGSSPQNIKSEGVEILILMDVSESMMAEDDKPNRLEHAKKELGRLLDLMSGNKVGLVVFAGSSFLVSPLTPDYSALKTFMDPITTSSVSTQGTVVRNALEEAESAFERGGTEDDETSKVTRVIIIASDGEDEEEGAIKYAKKLADKGIKIYTVGFGTEQGAPIPVRDEFGNLKGYKKDQNNKVVLSTHSGKFLTNLANVGGGKYFYAVMGGNQMDILQKEIDRLEKTKFDTQVATDYNEKYQIVLALGFLLALLDLMINEKRGQGHIWKGRFEIAQS